MTGAGFEANLLHFFCLFILVGCSSPDSPSVPSESGGGPGGGGAGDSRKSNADDSAEAESEEVSEPQLVDEDSGLPDDSDEQNAIIEQDPDLFIGGPAGQTDAEEEYRNSDELEDILYSYSKDFLSDQIETGAQLSGWTKKADQNFKELKKALNPNAKTLRVIQSADLSLSEKTRILERGSHWLQQEYLRERKKEDFDESSPRVDGILESIRTIAVFFGENHEQIKEDSVSAKAAAVYIIRHRKFLNDLDEELEQ